MCGICGQVNYEGIVPETVQAMADTLRHRGPDDQGLYVDEFVGLGHRRLSIIDLDGGHQPMCNEDQSLWIVFNGEIYNYRDLRSRLKHTHQFRTDSDTEVILHLYEEIGEHCVEHLRGMFAFAIWDARERSLFLARDHLGQKPLFYALQGRGLLFASEIKGILAADSSMRQMDCEALHQYLTLRIIAPPRTMYTPVRKLAPGHRLRFQDGNLTIERYWHLRYEPKLQLNEDDLLDELDQRLQETVRYHMVSDVPVGAFLSGGLDSSLIVAMMSRIADKPVKTFSGGIPYEGYSELPYARLAAQNSGTSHFEETFDASLAQILPQLVWHLDEPSDHLSAPMYCLSSMARRQVKVVLDGTGGDELFGGYDRYFANRYVDYYAHLPEGVRRHVIGQALQWAPDGFWYKSLSHKLKWINQLSFSTGGRRYAQSLGYFYFNQDYRAQLYGDVLTRSLNGFDPAESIYCYFECDNAQDLVDKMLYADSMVRMPDHPVMILDRISMAHGLEARSPYMDHELAEFVARIPASMKIRGRTRRYIQTRLAERYLPPELLKRKKQGFSSGLPYLLADEFRHLFQTFLSDSHLVRDGYLNQEPIHNMLIDHVGRRADHGNRLWLLCNSEIWYRMAIEGWPTACMEELIARSRVAEGKAMHGLAPI
jgi:asparagine synthase (glutamine-hydrolysing)